MTEVNLVHELKRLEIKSNKIWYIKAKINYYMGNLMENFKVNTSKDDEHFVITQSYKQLYQELKKLKKERGRLIHILGAPGTGKSANIFHAAGELGLKVYNVKLNLLRKDASPKAVFEAMFNGLNDDLKLESREELYKRLRNFDMVLIADAFHDSHLQNPNAVGFSQWTNQVGLKAFPFYLMCIKEYTKYRKDFQKINLVFQSSWRVHIGGKKYDLFSDLGILSRILVFILGKIFTTIEISYSQDETVKIVKNHIPQADDKTILSYIKKYGYKPRFICDVLEKGAL